MYDVLDESFRALIDETATPRLLATGFQFTEGPIWHSKDQFLLFSDIPSNARRRWDASGISDDSLASNKGNGMTYDRDLNLIVCEHATSQVARFVDGKREVIASHFEGKEFNSPNDVVVSKDGSIYFTDPTYGRMLYYGEERPEPLDFRGVYRLAQGRGDPELLVEKKQFTQPNGLCFSPDETLLYVNDSEECFIQVFDVVDGRLASPRRFAEGITDPDIEGVPDGMKCDAQGNVWVTAPGGLWVYAPNGLLIGKIAFPEVPANLHWGGKDWRTLFVTARTSLYALETKIGPHIEAFMQA